jgi:hypothetical protein
VRRDEFLETRLVDRTNAGLTSVPMTGNPLLANTAASGLPSLPSPMTEIFI